MEPFTHPLNVRYLEVDQQGVVFNSWYLAYFDDAMTAFLEHRGLPYDQLIASGHDVMLVRSEIDWRAGVRWKDDVAVAVSTSRMGTTSFTLDFQVLRAGEPVVDGRTTYVSVTTDTWQKAPIPANLRAALEPVVPLYDGAMTKSAR